MALIENFILLWEHEFRNTLKVLRAIPQDQFDYRPHEKFFTAGKLAWHIVSIEGYFGRGILGDRLVLGDATKARQPGTIAEIVAVAEREHPLIVAGWRTLSDAELRAKIPFVRRDGQVWMELPRLTLLQTAMMSHTIHHRGQLTLMLRLMGAPVPGMYGPSGDERVVD